MNMSYLTPINNNTPEELQKQTIPQQNDHSITLIPYSDVYSTLRNTYIRKTRYLYSSATDMQHIVRCIQGNAIRGGIKPNFIWLAQEHSLDKERIKNIQRKWNRDIKNMVAGTGGDLYSYQKKIIEELCLTGEMFSLVTLSQINLERDKTKTLLIHPIYSESIDPTIDKVSKGEGVNRVRIINGIEYDCDNRTKAYWFRDPLNKNINDWNTALQLPAQLLIKIL